MTERFRSFDAGRLLFVGGAGSLAAGDVVLRTLPDLVGLGESVALPALAVLVTGLFFDAATAGWMFGWLLLLGVVFQLAPYLLPERFAPVTAGLPFRLALVATTGTVGIAVERLIFETWIGAGTTPLDVPLIAAGIVVAGGVVAFAVIYGLPPIGRSIPLLSAPDATYVSSDRVPLEMPLLLFGLRCAVLAALLGVLLAEVSLLYPLPELLVLGVIAHDEVLVRVGSVNKLPARRDLAERISVGSVAVWHGLRTSFSSLYLVATLFFLITFVLANVTELALFGRFGARPAAVGFVAACLGIITVHVTVFCVRALEQFADTQHRHRVPGLLLPAALLLGTLGRYRPDDQFVLVTPPSTAWVLVGVLGTVAILTVVRPRWFPVLPVPVRYLGPLAFAVFWGAGLGLAWNWDVGAALVPDGASPLLADAVRAAGDVGFVFLLCLIPFLLLELLRLDLQTDRIYDSLVGYALGPWGAVCISVPVLVVVLSAAYGTTEPITSAPPMVRYPVTIFLSVLTLRACYRTGVGLLHAAKASVAAVHSYFTQSV